MDKNPNAIEIFSWKISNFLMKFWFHACDQKISIAAFLCEIIPKELLLRWTAAFKADRGDGRPKDIN